MRIEVSDAMKTGRTSEILFSPSVKEKREQNKFTTDDAQRVAARNQNKSEASL